MFSDLHLMQLSELSDVVISAKSSGIIDALAVDKPVIEFYRFSDTDPNLRKTHDGSYTSIFREVGLALGANTSKELGILIKSALIRKDECWKRQQQAFRDICKPTENATLAVIKCLVTELKKKQEFMLKQASSSIQNPAFFSTIPNQRFNSKINA